MNSADRLKVIIAERKAWEAFGWGPVLAVWGLVLAVRMVVEIGTGSRADLGTGAYLLILLVQGTLALVPGASSGIKQWTMHGFWVLVAVPAWFLGSWAPAFGWFPTLGGSVLELLFLAGGLTTVGLVKTRRPVVCGGAVLAIGAVLVAVFPALWVWRPVLMLLAFGVPALLVLERKTPPAR